MTLWKHQQEAVERAKSLNYFGLFFDMGTGKTLTIIKILEDKCSLERKLLKTLIITPVVVIENFAREIRRFSTIPRNRVLPLVGSGKEKLALFSTVKSDDYVVVTNYEALYNSDLFQAIREWGPECIILDEIHKIKDTASKRTKLCTILSKDAKYRFGLSGTPILNTQLDLFSQITFLDQGATFGKNFYSFRAKYFYDKMAWKKGAQGYFPDWRPREGIDQELKKLIAPFSSVAKKSECLDLPPLVTKQVLVGMGVDQTKAYKEMKRDFVTYIKDAACTADLAITRSLRLQQIVSGFISLEDASELMFKDIPRLTVLRNLLEDITPNHKAIVWCCFKMNYQMVETVCKALGVQYAMLHGETLDRQAEIDKFQSDDAVRVMIANPAAGGIGVNLTAASYMIYYSKNYSLENDLQSEARNYRGGSEVHKSIVRIDIVSLGTIDEIIMKILKEKKEIGQNVIGTKEIVSRLKFGL